MAKIKVYDGTEWVELLKSSDISAWAKASTKPSYSFGEISAGNLTVGSGNYYLNMRSGHNSYNGGIYYSTPGNEAIVFANKNAVTSWIFATTDVTGMANWTGLTPSMQIKNGKVVINKLIADGTNAAYNLDVNGTLNATTIYENGSTLVDKYLGISSKAADSDKLDGHDSSYFATASALSGYLPLSGGGLTNTLSVTSATESVSPISAAIEVRERNRATTSVSETYANAPRIGFHWGGRYYANLAYISNEFRFVDYNAGAYVNVRAATLFENDVALSSKYQPIGNYAGTSVATQSANGLMSATDKTNLDAIVASLNNDDSDSVVNRLKDVLSVFQDYPEGTTVLSALNSKLNLSGGTMTGAIQFGDAYHRISQEDGSTITRAGGGTIALPVGSGTKGMAILADEGGDFGLLYVSSDGAVVANSGDNGYVFKVYDKDMNYSDFTSGTGFLLGVKQSGAGTSIAGNLEVGSVIYEGGTALSSKYVPQTSSARPGVTKLYRRDDNSGYNLQTSWNGTHWVLAGYDASDNYHAGVRVALATYSNIINYIGRPADGSDGVQFSQYSGATDNPSNDWYSHIIMNHANSLGYYTEIATSFNSDDVYFRRRTSGTTYNWKRFAFSGEAQPANGGNADTLDGYDSSYFYPASNPNGYTTLTLVSSGGNNGSATTAARSDHTHALATAITYDDNNNEVLGQSGFMSTYEKTWLTAALENDILAAGTTFYRMGSISYLKLPGPGQGTKPQQRSLSFPNSSGVIATQEWVGDQGYTTDSVSGVNDGTNWTSITINGVTKTIPSGGGSGTVTSVGAGTGLSISGTASVNPTVNIASGYKLPTTSEWNNKSGKLYHHILHLRINYQVFAYSFYSTSNSGTTLATLASKLNLNPSVILASEYVTGDAVHIQTASYRKGASAATIDSGDWYGKNGSNYMTRSSAAGLSITIDSEYITEA